MNPSRIDRIAAAIFQANLERQRFEPLAGDDIPTSMDEAYRIQDAVYARFATEGGLGPLGGHKIALTSKAVQQLCGVGEPAYGRIFASQIRESGARLNAGEFVRLGLEFEVAVRIGRDLPAGTTDWTRHSVAPYVAQLMPAFEIIEDRNADYARLDATSILTDRCWCAGIVLGAGVQRDPVPDPDGLAVSLLWNGEIVDRGTTNDSMDHPFNGLAWVANHLSRQGRVLARGDVVMTGSALKTRFAGAGDRVTYRIESLGEVTVTVD